MNENFVQLLNLPRVPESILQNLPADFSQYRTKVNYFTFNWSESHNQELNKWAKETIGPNLYFAFMLTHGDLLLHKDVGTVLKLNYVIDPGGDQVVTRFWDNNKKDQLAEYIIEPHRWHIFRADVFHSVHGIKKSQTRFSITAKIF